MARPPAHHHRVTHSLAGGSYHGPRVVRGWASLHLQRDMSQQIAHQFSWVHTSKPDTSSVSFLVNEPSNPPIRRAFLTLFWHLLPEKVSRVSKNKICGKSNQWIHDCRNRIWCPPNTRHRARSYSCFLSCWICWNSGSLKSKLGFILFYWWRAKG